MRRERTRPAGKRTPYPTLKSDRVSKRSLCSRLTGPGNAPIIRECENDLDVMFCGGCNDMVEALEPLRAVVENPFTAVPHLGKLRNRYAIIMVGEIYLIVSQAARLCAG